MKEFFTKIGIGVLIGVILTIVYQTINFLSGDTIIFNERLVLSLLYYILYSVPLTLVNSYAFNYVYYKCYWGKYQKYKTVIGLVVSVFVTLITIFFVRLFIETILEGETWKEFILSERVSFYFITLAITLIISFVFHIIFYFREREKTKVKEQKVIAGTASARFDALKNQLDPHFLFNSLNVLTSLIEENPKSAQKFTTALSKVYRYVLEQKNKESVTVDEELKFAKTYMSLLKMRFEDSIVFEIPEQASNPESCVVPLSLQLLLENAVKHNMVTSSKPLHIKIYEDNGYLIVLNNLQPKQIVKKSSGVGLENIRQRYQLLSNKKVIINQRAKDFAVAIPMLTKNLSIMRQAQVSQQRLNEGYVKARQRMEELKGFYMSIISYCIVIPFLIYIWYTYTPYTIQWFWFPIVFWGLSNIIQAYRVFAKNPAFGADWEQRKIEQYMREEEEQQKRWN